MLLDNVYLLYTVLPVSSTYFVYHVMAPTLMHFDDMHSVSTRVVKLQPVHLVLRPVFKFTNLVSDMLLNYILTNFSLVYLHWYFFAFDGLFVSFRTSVCSDSTMTVNRHTIHDTRANQLSIPTLRHKVN